MMRILVALLTVILLALIDLPAEASRPYRAYVPLVYAQWTEPDLRFGVIHNIGGVATMNALGVRNYYEYRWGEPLPGMDRVQLVGRPTISTDGLDAFIVKHPGLYWMIGNEPNNPAQDNLSPGAYAVLFQSWSQRIKGLDPTAKIVTAGINNWPDGAAATRYLHEFRNAYRELYGVYPTPDVWNVHAYPPFKMVDSRPRSVCSATATKGYVSDALSYLRREGITAPVWLTEFGVDWRLDGDPCIEVFMVEMVRYLQGSQIDRWYWYSLNSTEYGHSGSLVNLDGSITRLGMLYRGLSRD